MNKLRAITSYLKHGSLSGYLNILPRIGVCVG